MTRNLLLLACSLGFVAALLEVALRFVFPVPPTWRDPQVRHLESPLLGWVLPPNSSAYTIDAPVSVNSHGLRDDEFPREKPEGEIRVLALGDSFTFPMGVRFEDSYVQQLERKLGERFFPRPVQVINAGVAGYKTSHELVYLLAEGLDFEPDLVTVGFYWNDLIGNDPPLPDLATTPRLLPDARLKPRSERWLPSWIRDPLRKSVLLYQTTIRAKRLLSRLKNAPPTALQQMQRALLEGDRAALETHWEATGRRLLEIQRAAAEAGAPTVLLAFPMEALVRAEDPPRLEAEELSRIWEPTGMPFIDLQPAYRRALEAGENPYLPYDLHPNAVGMRIAADAVYRAIEAHDLLPDQAAEDSESR